MFFIANVLCSLRLFKLKFEGQTSYTENLTEKLIEIIFANSGLAQSGFGQPQTSACYNISCDGFHD